MSVISSLLLFLLFASFHSCYGRHLGVIAKEPEAKSLLPSKNDVTTSTPGAGKGEGVVNQVSRVEKDDHKPLSSSSLKTKENTASVAVETELLPSNASWQAHHKISDEDEEPGYDSDYPSPKTHPPAHN